MPLEPMILRCNVDEPFDCIRLKFARLQLASRSRRLELIQGKIANVTVSLLISCSLLTFAPIVRAQRQRILHGVVLDSNSAPVYKARIEFRTAAETRLATTDNNGSFAVPNITVGGTLLVSYPGFTPVKIEVRTDALGDSLQIHLQPAPVVERIVVTPGGADRISALPNSQFSISKHEIELSGSLALDDILREAPGFTLFRRSGSLFANPTSQGVSLRGVGASGASRATVLLDGVPINTPFGGWVYWDRLPRSSIENVEVVSGAASDLYGSGALGGVVNIVTKPLLKSFVTAESSYGNQNSPAISLDTGFVRDGWGISVTAQALRTNGYVPVPRGQRGLVDTVVGTRDLSGALRISRNLGQTGSFFFRADSFGESRLNGTPLQTNNTRMALIDLGIDWANANSNYFSLRMYGSDELFIQDFSSVAANRNSESLTNRQRNPSQQLGIAGQWRRTFSGRQTIIAGIEGRDMRGHSAETTFNSSRPTANIDAGGRQRAFGFFGQDTFQFKRSWSLTFGARVDRWLNSRGFSSRIPLTSGASTANLFSDRSETALSPRVSLLHTFKHLALTASFYRAFRAPTLNELYRSFRVGNVATNANATLRAERLTGGEAGASAKSWSERLIVRGVVFWSELGEPIANVTLTAPPNLITRQRQNLGRIRARGTEISVAAQLTKRLQISGEYLLTDSTVISFPTNSALEGLRVPQIAKHQVNLQLGYMNRNWTAGLQARFVGRQFEDDQNTLPLAAFFTMDAEVSRAISQHLKLFAAAQNLTGVRYQIARTPTLTIGPPVLARAGIRFSF
jgi:outer membrane receptor protein involved in Fe transport